jgi:DNA-directed RNA polymerase specialized sigma24 family protein
MNPIHNMSSFAQYTSNLHQPLYRFGRILTKTPAAADQLTHEVLEELWEKRETLSTEKAVRRFVTQRMFQRSQSWIHEQVLHMLATQPSNN